MMTQITKVSSNIEDPVLQVIEKCKPSQCLLIIRFLKNNHMSFSLKFVTEERVKKDIVASTQNKYVELTLFLPR